MIQRNISPIKTGLKSASGFSILELLVAITIMSVLVSIIVPVLQNARRKGKQIQCLNNMRQIGVALRLYQNEHKGKYPQVAPDATHNWQNALADPALGGVYMPSGMLGTDGSGKPKFKTSLMCPTLVKRSDFLTYGEYWGYSLNSTRVDISYNAGGAPWNMIQYQGGDLDDIYTESSQAAVLTDGNFVQWWDGDWDAFTSADWYIWGVIPIHNDGVNILFLDGHVDFKNVISVADKAQFNSIWFHNVPSTLGNPW